MWQNVRLVTHVWAHLCVWDKQNRVPLVDEQFHGATRGQKLNARGAFAYWEEKFVLLTICKQSWPQRERRQPEITGDIDSYRRVLLIYGCFPQLENTWQIRALQLGKGSSVVLCKGPKILPSMKNRDRRVAKATIAAHISTKRDGHVIFFQKKQTQCLTWARYQPEWQKWN